MVIVGGFFFALQHYWSDTISKFDEEIKNGGKTNNTPKLMKKKSNKITKIYGKKIIIRILISKNQLFFNEFQKWKGEGC